MKATSIIFALCLVSSTNNAAQNTSQEPNKLDFVNQQLATQKLNELLAISTPELINAQAEYYRKLHQALINNGFSEEDALKIVLAKASSNK
ncbi:hypothetical protein RS130_15670 [Paraglaciecola aquimarina]|uniref:Orphan protein n=1 Tax=Paraglaciecola aquimarina TaxID=1235557 RepID=A0ABU3SYQ8_9ALTE|nr:hypothetical protein [Paraglaciecola aquimarina]MDU0355149.1 hypothetical protein [Paraglaciecola aquimarina]